VSVRTACLAACIALFATGPASTASADPPAATPDPSFTPPDWVNRPSRDEVLQVFPRNVQAQQSGGRAVLRCTVTVAGVLADCTVSEETPAGLGFGAAALSLSQQFTFTPARRDGVRIPAGVTIPINFEAGDHRVNALLFDSLPFLQAPNVQDMQRDYPARARQAGIGGYVLMRCRFESGNRIGGCRLLQESPPNQGFADAAERLANSIRVAGPRPPRGYSIDQLYLALPMSFSTETAPVIDDPPLTRRPGPAEIAAAYPAAARGSEAAGEVALRCHVVAGGALADCRAEGAMPADRGFEAAALVLAPLYTVALWTHQGQPTVGAEVRIQVTFPVPPRARAS
jgi:TonB family protein